MIRTNQVNQINLINHACLPVGRVQTIYDIIKAHGGEIKAETTVDVANPGKSWKGEGTEFSIRLPTNKAV